MARRLWRQIARATRPVRRMNLRPEEDKGFGQIPTGCALSPDEKTLFVTCGGANAVAVVDIAGKPRVNGYVPTGWYPIAIAQRDGRLVIANSKGIGARPE